MRDRAAGVVEGASLKLRAQSCPLHRLSAVPLPRERKLGGS